MPRNNTTKKLATTQLPTALARPLLATQLPILNRQEHPFHLVVLSSCSCLTVCSAFTAVSGLIFLLPYVKYIRHLMYEEFFILILAYSIYRLFKTYRNKVFQNSVIFSWALFFKRDALVAETPVGNLYFQPSLGQNQQGLKYGISVSNTPSPSWQQLETTGNIKSTAPKALTEITPDPISAIPDPTPAIPSTPYNTDTTYPLVLEKWIPVEIGPSQSFQFNPLLETVVSPEPICQETTEIVGKVFPSIMLLLPLVPYILPWLLRFGKILKLFFSARNSRAIIEPPQDLPIEPPQDLPIELPQDLPSEPPIELAVEPPIELAVEPPIELAVEVPIQQQVNIPDTVCDMILPWKAGVHRLEPTIKYHGKQFRSHIFFGRDVENNPYLNRQNRLHQQYIHISQSIRQKKWHIIPQAVPSNYFNKHISETIVDWRDKTGYGQNSQLREVNIPAERNRPPNLMESLLASFKKAVLEEGKVNLLVKEVCAEVLNRIVEDVVGIQPYEFYKDISEEVRDIHEPALGSPPQAEEVRDIHEPALGSPPQAEEVQDIHEPALGSPPQAEEVRNISESVPNLIQEIEEEVEDFPNRRSYYVVPIVVIAVLGIVVASFAAQGAVLS